MYNVKKIRNEDIILKKILAILLALVIMCFTFVACSDNTDKDPENTEKTEQNATDSVELTLENFDTYFEFVEESFFTKDSSGNVDALRFRHYYKLKDDYKVDVEKSNIEIVYNHSYRSRPVTVDFNNETFEFGQKSGEKKTIENRTINKLTMINYKDCAILLLQPDKVDKNTKETLFYDDFELKSVKGTLYFTAE